jgi:UDP-GlcNAc:undecaprenyl-phosphate GlcNAc-1-phosphate transferase
VFDINLVILTRILEKRPVGLGGRDHSSHRLLAAGLSQRQTLLVLYGFCALYGGLGLIVSVAPPELAFAVGAAGLLLLALLMPVMFWLRRRYQLNPAQREAVK